MSAKKQLGGALSGAGAGAGIGALGGPVGIGIGAGVGGLLGLMTSGDDEDQQKAMQLLQENKDMYSKLQTPQYSTYTPEQYQLAGKYTPEEMKASLVQEDPALRLQQQNALAKLSGLADTGLSEVDLAQFTKAQNQAGQMARSGSEAALQNAEARGIAGGGQELALREIANQNAAQRAQEAMLDQSAASAKQRALYAQAYGESLGGLRNQDYRANAANTGILNEFTQKNTGNRNEAQQYNIQNQQAVMNANTGVNNQAQQYNNTMKGQSYKDQLEKINGQTGANKGIYQGYADKSAADQSALNSGLGLAATTGLGAANIMKNKQTTQTGA